MPPAGSRSRITITANAWTNAAIGVALSLYGTGVISLEQAFGGFGDPVIIFIAALFVVSDGLEASGVTAWAGQQLVDRARGSRTRLVVLLMALVAVVTALISVNGAVAALLPMVVVTAVRLKLSPSKFLIPLAFGAHAGSLLVLTGTPVNVLVSELAVGAGGLGGDGAHTDFLPGRSRSRATMPMMKRVNRTRTAEASPYSW